MFSDSELEQMWAQIASGSASVRQIARRNDVTPGKLAGAIYKWRKRHGIAPLRPQHRNKPSARPKAAPPAKANHRVAAPKPAMAREDTSANVVRAAATEHPKNNVVWITRPNCICAWVYDARDASGLRLGCGHPRMIRNGVALPYCQHHAKLAYKGGFDAQ